MAHNVDREVLVGFIAESKGYLPEILKGIETFRATPDKPEALEEAHRFVHTIKGASSMVGLSVLSHVAYQLEESVEEMAAGKTIITDHIVKLLAETLTHIESYLDGALSGLQQDEPFLVEVTRLIRRLRGLPIEEDPAAIEQVMTELAGFFRDSYSTEPQPEYFAYDLPTVDPPAMPEVPLFEYDVHDEEPPTQPATEPKPPAEHRAPTGLKDIPQELAEIFALEAEDHLRNMSLSLPALEKDPDNKELLQSIRRSAHSLKGTAAMVGFREITQLAHRMEDLLDLLYDGETRMTSEIMSLLLASTYALEDMAANNTDELTSQHLYSLYAKLLGPPGAPAVQQTTLQHVEAAQPETAPEPPPSTLKGTTGRLEAFREQVEIIQQSLGETTQPAVARERVSSTAPQKRGQVVRVPIERLDELVRLVSELVITRTSFEQSMAEFAREVEEHQSSSERLRRVSSKLESQYEASSLGGGKLVPFLLSGVPGIGNRLPMAPLSGLSPVNQNTYGQNTYGQNAYGFDDLEFDRYTEFHLLTRELSETTSDIQSVGNELANLSGDFESYLNRQGRLYSEVQDKLMRIRMVPLSTLAARLHRTVRTVATKQGKLVDLVLEGDNTQLDKTVLDEISDSLLHILRNSVDHGIEPPAVRQVKGKLAHGTIRMRAYHEGTQIVLQISDDGAGLDVEQLHAAAVREGYVSAADASQMSSEDLLSLVFLPGFSTAYEISEVSGRGVGLDIVKATVNKLKGTISLASTPGAGAVFTIRLPMTLAITRALLVKAGGETFAMPIGAVTQIMRLSRDEIDQVAQEPVVRVAGEVYPVLFLAKALGLKQPDDESVRRPPVLLVNVEGRQIALVVDQLLGGREIVVKNLGSHLRRVQGVSGATLMGDGSVVLILNPGDLIHEPVRHTSSSRLTSATVSGAPREALTIMVVDDSPSVRRIISNLIKTAGWKPVQAKDGLEALEFLHHSATAPDLMLLDIEMPRMDGYQLLSTLRAQEAYHELPVVILTSRAGDKHRQKAFDLGATEYLVKPYQDEALLNLVRRLTLKQKGPASA
jgi:chemosensory pili system protein ChpA (sensor histidine kinase/response regulator)